MSFDAFIQLDGIKGESTDDKHKDWIEILNFSFGASQPQSGTVSSAGNLGAARVNLQNFNFLHHLDLASPKLFEACVTGQTIKSAIVNLNRAGGDKGKYMEYKLTDVIVTSVGKGGDSKAESDVPVESVSLAFGKIELIYTKIGIDGRAAGNTSAGWDLKANKKV
ncbi:MULTISPECIES: Hcp family type VI secretion system effector [Hydrocarboniphaga]|jgi:type VI secretion system secreted protein Hcp|uniref:Type VI secretion system effector, Hcp1 family n=1 Tax=Hydrocarboniphaga effusa AP103 TaxID=1172194 RepID=I8I064_9GAMM|nr:MULTISPECIES: type VI secretion system tube protein Hcp [Hydrocarboniphaga]EIT69356.1 type VI secretion system effector, Hcp1 family [Hydrocarboniphaga effusa AP103]MDZ4081078.1 type VI secretion system tube protein Hcp [Hydrocarboniphaga sp.]|eukprot:TRINITY_DN54186_c0_g1_i1.p2 TRINITY_DN54186_c0_g1~~TRINITY_DN54186_c0_g1_i1.p2  ORF type:complete len:165 (-),score=43.82 TRINITY_DN54186_c0_g1_i1:183-677(-)